MTKFQQFPGGASRLTFRSSNARASGVAPGRQEIAMRPARPASLAAALVCVLLLAACATTSEPTRPAVSVPSAFAEPALGSAVLNREWWQGFGSEELVRLIGEAQASNSDVAIAMERVRQAELQARLAGASLFPIFDVSAGTSASYGKPGSGFNAAGEQSSSASLGVSYEVDLWGRVAAVARGARASLDATRFDAETVRLSIETGVASGYFQVIALRMRLVVARENLAIAEKVFSIVEARYRFGAASALDVSRQRTTVLSQRAAVQPLEVQERQTISALAILLGRPPQGLQIAALNFDRFAIPDVGPGLPSDLLTRRPDLASAESQLAGADANVAAARAALLPAVTLGGSVGVSGASLLALSSPAWGVEIAASFARSLFSADDRRTTVALNESSRRQLVESYRRSIYTAFKEVEDALSNAARDRAQEESQFAIRQEAQRSLQLAELRYREGADDLSSVLDAQRTLFSANDALAQLRLARLTDSLDLFKALGGGWTRPDEALAAVGNEPR